MPDDPFCDSPASLDLDDNDTLDLDEVLRKEEEDLAFCASLTFTSSEIENKEQTTDESEQDSDECEQDSDESEQNSDVEPVLPVIELRYGDVLHDLIVLSSEAFRAVRDAGGPWIRGQDLFANEWRLLGQPLSELFALVRQDMRLESFDAETEVYGMYMIFESIKGNFIYESDSIASVLTLMDVLKVHIETAGMQGRDIAMDPFRIELGVTEKYLDDVSQEDKDTSAETKDVLADDSGKTTVLPEDDTSCMHSKVETSEQNPAFDGDDSASVSCESSISLKGQASVGHDTRNDEVYNVDDILPDEHLKMVDIVLEDFATPLCYGCGRRPPKRPANELADLTSGESVDSLTPNREHKKNRTGSPSRQGV
ncbi:hypothetical protein BGZ67_008866 [Mortierella alpina]|nr:hypothetical protein BGZ67_008866 [Mortierella alpina]